MTYFFKRVLKWWRRVRMHKVRRGDGNTTPSTPVRDPKVKEEDKIKYSEAGAQSKYELVSHHEVSPFRRMRHIFTGYRKDLESTECLRTMFSLHNETLNIWTHFLPAILFFYLSVHTYFDELWGEDTIHHVMFAILLIATVNCFVSSTLYHTFLGHKHEHVVERCVRLDYSGISLLIIGSFYPPIFYVFFCHPEHQFTYLAGISILGFLGVVGPQFNFYHTDKFSPMRVLLMAGTAASGVVPTIHAYYYLPQIEGSVHTPADLIKKGAELLTNDDIYFNVSIMYAMYGIGLFFYLTKFPESAFPGKFDIWFHSHQFWHVFVFFGAFVHYLNCINIYQKWKLDVPGGICTSSNSVPMSTTAIQFIN